LVLEKGTKIGSDLPALRDALPAELYPRGQHN
jgi:hypothetical protein